ncbi:MAG: MlaD family protein [Candidatus Methylomirabilales bacterium]
MNPRTNVKLMAGLFVFAGLLLFAASIFFLGERGRYFAVQHPLKASFTNVAGLHQGAPVRLAGVAVGRVTAIRLPTPPNQKVLVELNVAGTAIESIRADSIARIESMGFLGDKFVEISVGTQDSTLPDGATLRTEEPPGFGALVGQGRQALGHVERFAASLEEGKGALPWLIQDPASRQFMQDLGRTAEALAAVSKEVKEGRGLAHALIYDPEGGRMIEKASQTVAQVQSLLQEIREGDGALPTLLFDPNSKQLLENLTEVSEHLKAISAKMAQGEGTLGALLVDPTAYEDLTALLEGAQRSWILRWVIRSTLKSGREARHEKATVGAIEK